MHFALLIGYGAGAINPYLAFETLAEHDRRRTILKSVAVDEAIEHYIKAINKGLLKVMSKMGISTLQSYRGAQIFEAVGLNHDVIDRYFTWTASRIEGVGLDVIAAECAARHHAAFEVLPSLDGDLDVGGQYQWRRRGEFHMFNPETIAKLQHAVRRGSFDALQAVQRPAERTEQQALHAARPARVQAAASRSRSTRSSRRARSSSASRPAPCRSARSAARRTRTWPSP